MSALTPEQEAHVREIVGEMLATADVERSRESIEVYRKFKERSDRLFGITPSSVSQPDPAAEQSEAEQLARKSSKPGSADPLQGDR